ncbi:hypothetical protein M0802_002746 [Mischocyttarus mexicanus]|nr:hypothetical protein M0802_002746 [Mischocyttarus mexicanus]
MADKEMNLITVAKENKKSLLEKYSIPLENLTYEYITLCKDPKKLEQITAILRSGEEGIFPDLTRHAEECLKKLKPNSILTAKPLPILNRQELNKNEQKILYDDMTIWIREMHIRENNLNNEKKNIETSPFNIPSIRCKPNISKKEVNEKSDDDRKLKRISSCDYAAWDKYDVETEINRIDLQEEIKLIEDKEMQKRQNIKEQEIMEPLEINNFDKSKFTSTEIDRIVEQELQKGNEFFTIGEYDKAIRYYNFCISTNNCLRAINERAETYVKLGRYRDAIKDYDFLISQDNTNTTALFQRAYSYERLGKEDKALTDHGKDSKVEPNCKRDNPKVERFKKLESIELGFPNKEEPLSDEREKVTDSCLIVDVISADSTLNENTNEKYDDEKYDDEKSNGIAISDLIATCGNVALNKYDVNTKENHVDLIEENKIEADEMKGRNSKRKKKTRKRLENVDNISTAYEFFRLWHSLKNQDHDLQQHAQLLRSIKHNNLVKFIGYKLDENMLSLILRCLEKYFCEPKDCELLVCYLKSISQIERFCIVQFFLDKNDKQVLSNIFEFLKDQRCTDLPSLRQIYA